MGAFLAHHHDDQDPENPPAPYLLADREWDGNMGLAKEGTKMRKHREELGRYDPDRPEAAADKHDRDEGREHRQIDRQCAQIFPIPNVSRHMLRDPGGYRSDQNDGRREALRRPASNSGHCASADEEGREQKRDQHGRHDLGLSRRRQAKGHSGGLARHNLKVRGVRTTAQASKAPDRETKVLAGLHEGGVSGDHLGPGCCNGV